MGTIGLEILSALASFFAWRVWFYREFKESFLQSYGRYGVSALCRYLPAGTAWQIAALGRWAQSSAVMIVMILVSMTSGGLLSLVACTQVDCLIPWWLYATYLVPFLTAVIGISVWQRLPVRLWFQSVGVFGILDWAAEGTALYLLLSALSPTAPPLPLIFGGHFAAYVCGFLSGLAPAGLGVREVALVFFLRAYVPTTEAALAATTLRLVGILSEVVLFAPALLARRQTTNPVPLSL